MQYTIQASTNNFGVEIMSTEDFLSDKKAMDDFWVLLKELLDEEKKYHAKTGLIPNGEYHRDSAFGRSDEWDKIFFVVDGNNNRIGCAETTYDERWGSYRVGCVVVAKAYRHKGLGKLLMNTIINEYPNRDMSLNVSVGNPSGIEFYKSLGFHVADYHMVRLPKK